MIFPIILLFACGVLFIGLLLISIFMPILSKLIKNRYVKSISENKNLILQNMFLNFLLSVIAYTICYFDIKVYIRCILVAITYILIFINCKLMIKKINV
jgi:hypothetical protein